MKKLLLLLSLLTATTSFSQFWTAVPQAQAQSGIARPRTSTPEKQTYFQLDLEGIKATLATAPARFSGNSTVIIPFPDGNGNIKHFRMYNAPVLAPGLAMKYPGIRSYIGQGVEDASASIRITTTLFGLHAMTLTADNGTSYIDPFSKTGNYYISYNRQGLTSSRRSFECLTESGNGPQLRTAPPSALDNGIFRTYRFAMACTTEYSDFHIAAAGLEGGTLEQQKEAVLAAMATTIARLNTMYERDLSMSFQLVENNDLIIFIGEDNFDNNDVGAMIGQGTVEMNNLIGFDNYDIGHTVGTSGGGLGGGSPCTDGKAVGATGTGAPVGDPFDIDYVAHEVGHQFGAAHTFNNSCGGNVDTNWSYEPGSGSSIMAYAGICDPNVQSNSDAQFFAGSVAQIRARINGLANCAAQTPNNNTTPIPNAGSDYIIPKGTAFILTGSATDAQNDALTYTWEQYDREIAEMPPLPESTQGPNFRIQPITSSPVRYCPRLSDVLNNNLTPTWEVVSSVGRDYNFAFTVRDNNPDGGESATDFMKVTASDTAGPFVITSPNTIVSWQAGSNQNVTWDVAGTTGNGVDCAYVDVLLSTNGGLNFNNVLATMVPNDGSQTVTIPNAPGTANRIMVRGNGNIFYDVSNQNFAITSGGNSFALSPVGIQTAALCQGQSADFHFQYSLLGSFAGLTEFAVSGLPAGASAGFDMTSANAATAVVLSVQTLEDSAPGLYEITVTGTSGSVTKTVNFYVEVLNAQFDGVVLLEPADMATAVPTTATLTWTADANADRYFVNIATDSGMQNLVENALVYTNAYQPLNLLEGFTYYWMVTPMNAACSGQVSEIREFTTGVTSCAVIASTDVPVAIDPDTVNTIESTLEIADSFIISGTNVFMDITHTWVGDLWATLIHPDGTEVQLFAQECWDAHDVSATFSDSGSDQVCGSLPALSGVLRPDMGLSTLNGKNAAGTWTLRIYDEWAADGGSLNNWNLNLCQFQALSVAEQQLQSLTLYPNPNSGSFNIRLDNAGNQPYALKVFDIRGRLLHERKALATGAVLQERLDLNAQAGIYLLEVSSGEARKVLKFVVR